SWEALRKQSRQLQNQIEDRLVGLSRLGASLGAGAAAGSAAAGGAGGEAATRAQLDAAEAQLDVLLAKFQTVVEAMPSCPDVRGAASTALQQTLRRHREILTHYHREFSGIKATNRAYRQRSDLLGAAAQGGFGLSGSSRHGGGSAGGDADSMLMNERGKIDHAHMLADMALEQAYDTRTQLQSQRDMLTSVGGRVAHVIQRFPLVQNVLSKISSKRQKDNIVLGSVIAICTMILLWLIF
ncbi:hypothetical protein CXG81DRAFT_6436, partial [Caulochytrium protostelioides]